MTTPNRTMQDIAAESAAQRRGLCRNQWNSPDDLSDDNRGGLYWVTDRFGNTCLAWYAPGEVSGDWFDLTRSTGITIDEDTVTVGWLPIQYPESCENPWIRNRTRF